MVVECVVENEYVDLLIDVKLSDQFSVVSSRNANRYKSQQVFFTVFKHFVRLMTY